MRKLAIGVLVVVAVGAVLFQQIRIVKLQKAVSERSAISEREVGGMAERVDVPVPEVTPVTKDAPAAVPVVPAKKEPVVQAEPDVKPVAAGVGASPEAAAAGKGGAAKSGMGDFMKSIGSMMTNSAMKELIRHQAKAGLEMQYGRLFKLLDLSPEMAETLKAILMDRQMALMESGMAMFSGSAEDRKAAGESVKARKEAYDKQIAGLLGAADYDAFTQYESTQSERMQVEMFKSSQSSAKEPLSEQQEYDLVLAMYQARTNSPGLGWMGKQDEVPDPAMFRGAGVSNMLAEMDALRQQYTSVASSILTPAQAESFRGFLDSQKAMSEMQIKLASQIFGAEGDESDDPEGEKAAGVSVEPGAAPATLR